MPRTLPGSGFVEAVNPNGEKQIIPAAWMADGSPFASQFRLPPSTVARQEAAQKSASKAGRRTTADTPPSGDDKKE